MHFEPNFDLSTISSFAVGGSASYFIRAQDTTELLQAVHQAQNDQIPYVVIGDCTNSIFSDAGFRGLVIQNVSSRITFLDNNKVRVDSGLNWDSFVQATIDNGLWGLELMSGIPGTTGAAVVGNIAAYGQAVADTLLQIEVYDPETDTAQTLQASDLELGYRISNLQHANRRLVVLNLTFQLSQEQTTELTYNSATAVAQELDLPLDSLKNRREIILTARDRAGSLLNPESKTAGSFFRNPLVNKKQLDTIVQFEEDPNRSKNQILSMNKIHGGDELRVSAALVMLAAGFERGQRWGAVKLHDDHVLKIENTGAANAQDIKDVADQIQDVVAKKLGVSLEPEVNFIGKFN